MTFSESLVHDNNLDASRVALGMLVRYDSMELSNHIILRSVSTYAVPVPAERFANKNPGILAVQHSQAPFLVWVIPRPCLLRKNNCI